MDDTLYIIIAEKIKKKKKNIKKTSPNWEQGKQLGVKPLSLLDAMPLPHNQPRKWLNHRYLSGQYQLGEVPIGCVIVYNGKIVARGYNRRNTDKNSLSHAEMNAIKKASKKLGDWRLDNCEMYVTLEPCQMCSGAMVQARIKKVYIGCMNPKAGCAGSILNLLQIPEFNHQLEIERGILEQECSDLMKSFFRDLRSGNIKRASKYVQPK